MAAAEAGVSDMAQAHAYQWGVSVEAARQYLEHASGTGKYFATAIAFPFHHAEHGPGVFARDGMDASPTAAWPPFNVYSESERGENRILFSFLYVHRHCFLGRVVVFTVFFVYPPHTGISKRIEGFKRVC